MFQDREKELQRLNQQLLEDEEEEYSEEICEQEEQPDYDAYNADTCDVDLEEYSQAVYEEPNRGRRLVAAILLATAAALLLLAYLLAKKEGLL